MGETKLYKNFAAARAGFQGLVCGGEGCEERLTDTEEYPGVVSRESLTCLLCRAQLCIECIPKHAEECKPPEDEGPFSCPVCSGRLEIRSAETTTTGRGTAVCVGLENRAEVEKYLAPEFPRGRVPANVTSKPACGWTGLLSEYGKTWR